MDVESRGASSSRWRRSANRIAAALCFRKFDISFGRDDTSVSTGARARRGRRAIGHTTVCGAQSLRIARDRFFCRSLIVVSRRRGHRGLQSKGADRPDRARRCGLEGGAGEVSGALGSGDVLLLSPDHELDRYRVGDRVVGDRHGHTQTPRTNRKVAHVAVGNRDDGPEDDSRVVQVNPYLASEIDHTPRSHFALGRPVHELVIEATSPSPPRRRHELWHSWLLTQVTLGHRSREIWRPRCPPRMTRGTSDRSGVVSRPRRFERRTVHPLYVAVARPGRTATQFPGQKRT